MAEADNLSCMIFLLNTATLIDKSTSIYNSKKGKSKNLKSYFFHCIQSMMMHLKFAIPDDLTDDLFHMIFL